MQVETILNFLQAAMRMITRRSLVRMLSAPLLAQARLMEHTMYAQGGVLVMQWRDDSIVFGKLDDTKARHPESKGYSHSLTSCFYSKVSSGKLEHYGTLTKKGIVMFDKESADAGRFLQLHNSTLQQLINDENRMDFSFNGHGQMYAKGGRMMQYSSTAHGPYGPESVTRMELNGQQGTLYYAQFFNYRDEGMMTFYSGGIRTLQYSITSPSSYKKGKQHDLWKTLPSDNLTVRKAISAHEDTMRNLAGSDKLKKGNGFPVNMFWSR